MPCYEPFLTARLPDELRRDSDPAKPALCNKPFWLARRELKRPVI
jgi:hypothetical protein